MVPTLEKRVCARRRWVRHRSKVDWHPMIQRRGKKIDGCWPTMNQLIHHVLRQGLLETDYLVGSRESRQPLCECPSQTGAEEESVDPPPTRAGVEPPCSAGDASEFPLLANIRQSCGVVGKHPNKRPHGLTLKVLKAQANDPQLPEIDRQANLLLRPPAGDKLVADMGAPTLI